MLVEQVICLLIFWLTKPHDQPFATTVPPRKYTTDSVSEPLRRACRAPIERSCRRCRTDGVDDRRQLGRGVGEAGRRQAAVSHLGVQKHAIDGHLKFGRRGRRRLEGKLDGRAGQGLAHRGLEGAIARAIASCSTIHHMHLRGVVRAASFVKFVKAAPRAGLAAAAAVALVFLKGEPQHRFSSRVLRTSRSLTPAGTASRANRVACTFLVFSSAMAPWRSRRRPRGSEAVALRAVKGGVGLGTVRTLAFAVAPEGIVAENEVLKAGKQRKMRRVSTVRKPRRGAFATRDMRILVLVGPHRCARMS
mmetsp:Transcript_38855/g.115573  ORF Transcript_38855/g.115573 Transcript_38855/m.115573 type:complete len:305 (-) Transcript_38855:39-953(-)